ncbi:sporulation protein [Streptomyces sp. S8]|uniref:sporulation protein n=1 Tax=Streptomyces sp. S8 TaxID=1837283 RepID=UPI000A093725|nr:sporulation protein [Streptomyces sp. S8]ARI50759.1 sporulation protein [Streptomyces sp. S8]
MVFKKLLGALGVGGPSVDTVLQPDPALPGGALSGEVRLKGGGSDVTVEGITLLLVARAEMEGQDEEHEGTVVLERFTVGGGFRLAEGAEHSVPFTVTLPWETPVTHLHGQHLGPVLGIRTELEVAGARDKGDLDALAVAPLPAQEAVLEAFGQLGYGFRSADLEVGHIRGTGQQLPCYQEIEIVPPAEHAHAVNEIEVTFLASPGGLEVVIEADKRAGLFSGSHDTVHRFTTSHHPAPQADRNAEVDGWLRQVIGAHSAHAAPYPYAQGGGHQDHHHEGHHRSGPGTGAVVAGVAAGAAVGIVGGMVAAEVIDEIGDAFEGDDDGGEGDEGE